MNLDSFLPRVPASAADVSAGAVQAGLGGRAALAWDAGQAAPFSAVLGGACGSRPHETCEGRADSELESSESDSRLGRDGVEAMLQQMLPLHLLPLPPIEPLAAPAGPAAEGQEGDDGAAPAAEVSGLASDQDADSAGAAPSAGYLSWRGSAGKATTTPSMDEAWPQGVPAPADTLAAAAWESADDGLRSDPGLPRPEMAWAKSSFHPTIPIPAELASDAGMLPARVGLPERDAQTLLALEGEPHVAPSREGDLSRSVARAVAREIIAPILGGYEVRIDPPWHELAGDQPARDGSSDEPFLPGSGGGLAGMGAIMTAPAASETRGAELPADADLSRSRVYADARRAVFSARPDSTPTPQREPEENNNKNLQVTNSPRVNTPKDFVGIPVANQDPHVNRTLKVELAEAPLGLLGTPVQGSPWIRDGALPDAELGQASAGRAAQAAVSLLEPYGSSEQQANSRVVLRFKIGTEDLAVRIAVVAGQPTAEFQTKSAAVREAVMREWQALVPADSPLRVPVFTAEFSPEMRHGYSQQQEGRSRDRAGQNGLEPIFTSSSRPEQNPQPSPAPAPAALSSLRVLSVFA